MVENDPQDASAHYDLYQSLRQFTQVDEAFEHLDQAVNIDPVYGVEYLILADLAMEKMRPVGAIKMLEKAADIFPENPFIEMSLADVMIRTGEKGKALTILTALQEIPWSTTYHGNTPDYLEEMVTAAEAL
jgi:predicted Zn-dependent protease